MGSETVTSPTVDTAFLAGLRRDKRRFARLQLRDASAAEYAVQGALATALTNTRQFAGCSELKPGSSPYCATRSSTPSACTAAPPMYRR